ncbi:hypothetical protein THRCLA_21296 [Thraustotheca clavata]|uniref:Uncharacterized protein n=1 Tax=Thraustotheca clavata TaxID=74557 RepID=A0A1V9ZY08_9STRA|nr:hypothetical protein THRCLA_21296 [Thraustotheca clavata]
MTLTILCNVCDSSNDILLQKCTKCELLSDEHKLSIFLAKWKLMNPNEENVKLKETIATLEKDISELQNAAQCNSSNKRAKLAEKRLLEKLLITIQVNLNVKKFCLATNMNDKLKILSNVLLS